MYSLDDFVSLRKDVTFRVNRAATLYNFYLEDSQAPNYHFYLLDVSTYDVNDDADVFSDNGFYIPSNCLWGDDWAYNIEILATTLIDQLKLVYKLRSKEPEYRFSEF
jgi:hypothetical protein